MAQQYVAGVGVQANRIGQKVGAQASGQLPAEKKIAVSAAQPQGNEAGGLPQFFECCGKPGRSGFEGGVVSDPRIENIAAQHQGIGLAAGHVQEVVKRGLGGGNLGPQMDIGGQPDGARQRNVIQRPWLFR